MRKSRVIKDRWGDLKRRKNNEPTSRATTENYFGQPHKLGNTFRLRIRDKSAARPANQPA